MKITLPWGGETLDVEVPDTWNIIFPVNSENERRTKKKGPSLVEKALKNPVGAGRLSRENLKGKKILIVVDDNTRPTPVSSFFNNVIEELLEGGASKKNIMIIPALGIHTEMTEDEMEVKVGTQNLKGLSWKNHDAFDEESHRYFGKTSRGTPVYLNDEIHRADIIVTMGLIEPHLWAGFGGGMKNILPGLASAGTIGRHHEIIAEPPYLFNRVGMKPEENSFRRDLEEVRDMVEGEIFCINVCTNHQNEIIAAFAGDPIAAHREGVRFNYDNLGLHLERPVDGILVNSWPMEINFKQSMKCVGNSLPAVKPGGTVMAFLRAERGVDDLVLPEDSKPLWLVRAILRFLGPSRVKGFLETVRKGLNAEEKFLIYYSMQLIRQNDLYFYAPSVTHEDVKQMGFFVKCDGPRDVIKRGIKKLGKKATVAVFPEGGATFPIIG